MGGITTTSITSRTESIAVDRRTQPTLVILNPQLPPDLAQRQINPLSLPGFSLPSGSNGLFRLSGQGGSQIQPSAPDLSGLGQGVAQVQGVPSSARPNNSHRYLIETNPELTRLKSFLGSDYLLGQLGYDPDQAQKRLGDGLYEQRLIQQAVLARTGQRYLDGLSNDEALFRYLMDNAIAYKDSLHLRLGVGLTAEQVAALTHDIVWLEEAEVNGEKVLVPVLYLAQANGRLAPTGALIAGHDVSLISGGDLTNQGTLRASRDLAATAANLNNSGLIEASQRLDLLALDSIRNAAGGIIKGRDVNLTALTGDVLNERTVTTVEGQSKNARQRISILDNAARIEASHDLAVQAGRDLLSRGSVLQAGGDIDLSAGRDIELAAVETQDSNFRKDKRHTWEKGTVTQHAANIDAGGSLSVSAGRDLTVTASQVEASADAALSAGRNVTLESAANQSLDEYHYHGHGKRLDKEKQHVHQQSTELTAGGDVLISAGDNITLKASKIGAGDEAYLVAGDKIEVLAENDSDYSLYDMKKKGSWGSKKTQHDEVTDVKAIGSEISAGTDITLLSGGDQKYQGAKLQAGNDIALVSGGQITFEAVKDLHQEAHDKSDSDLAWTSSKGKGKTDETLRQTQLIAQGDLAIKAVDGLQIDYKHLGQKDVSQAIDAMVQADPNLAWLKEAEQRGDVDWRAVKELHDSYSYSHSGMGQGAMLAVIIIVTVLTYGAASAAIGTGAASGSALSAGAAATATTEAVAAGWANVALASAAASLASTGAVSTINNKGNVGTALKDTFSSDSLKQAMIAAGVAGITAGYFDDLLQTKTTPNTGKVTVDLSSVSGASRFAANQALQNLTSTAFSKVLGQGGNFGDALKDSLYNTFAAAGFNGIGDLGQKYHLETGSAQMVVMHALMGGLAAEARGDSFATGAAAAGLNEALVADLDKLVSSYSPQNREALLTMSSQLTGLIGALVQNPDASERDLNTAAWVAKNSTQYNYKLHEDKAKSAVEDSEERCKYDTACPTQGKSVDQAKVMDALRAIASKDEQAIRAFDQDTLSFANYTLRRDPEIRFDIFIPDTPWEKTLDWAKTGIDIFYPTPTGKTGAAVKATEKVSAEVLAKLGEKFGDDLAKQVPKGAATAAETAIQVPGRVQSRVNLMTGDKSAGWEHVVSRHFNPEVNASQFTISQSELRTLLQSKEVVSAPVTRTLESTQGVRYVREVNLSQPIGVDKFSGQPTSTMTVLTDKFGNLITTTPGVIK